MAYVREDQCHSCVLLSTHLQPKARLLFHRSPSDPRKPVWETRWGQHVNTARDGLHLSSVHRGLLVSWPKCAPICWQKRSASMCCNSNMSSLIFFVFVCFLSMFGPKVICAVTQTSSLLNELCLRFVVYFPINQIRGTNHNKYRVA